MDIRELIRHIQTMASDRAVARATGTHRHTVARYRQWATAHGLLSGTLPPLEELQSLLDATGAPAPPPQMVSTVLPYGALVEQLSREGVESTAIWQRLKERGYRGSLSSVYRFVHHLAPPVVRATVRVEGEPGDDAQVDFGYAGRMLDPQSGLPRKTWAFVMTLAWSRYQYVEFVFDQRVTTWLELHRHGFEFFGGVPQRVVLDNLKAGITQASWDDPQVQTAYRECAEHYDFLIAPCRPRTPEHKGKVEQGGVHYLKRNFLGGRTPTTLTQANAEVRVWCQTTAGQRWHGTTKEQPLARFQATEQGRLRPLPAVPYDLAVWKEARLHRDCYVVFDNSFYSAPFRLIGQQLRVRGGSQDVRLYTQEYALVATHPRAQQPGERHTHHDHLPPHKVPGLLRTRPASQDAASAVGVATAQVVQTLLEERVDRLPTVGRLLRLRETYGDTRLEAACRRALRFDDLSYPTIKRILVQGLDTEESPPASATDAAPARTFARTAADLLGHLFGGASWT